MKYISTRNNYKSCTSAEAITLGMVPGGGLFVPARLPEISVPSGIGISYQQMAKNVLSPLLSDFTESELDYCINSAYNENTFDINSVINLQALDTSTSVMELWHGPTAAFKDLALQIMPHFMNVSKKKIKDNAHTLILVATSGDTGKAALEGFKDADGISIVVFFPNEGVSEIQKLQMQTTTGSNTHVIAVNGNFDDCQTGVKRLFADDDLKRILAEKNVVFSSANSINWGRLSPQIVYYFYAYELLVKDGKIASGEEIDFCVPTGNFGNILAGYYAKKMGLPIHKLICSSNKNNVLSDFFKTGIYDRNREFHKTMSPSMDILISSNLERLIFEATNQDDTVSKLYSQLEKDGKFKISESAQKFMNSVFDSDWVTESEVLETIHDTYNKFSYTADPHTAVGIAVNNKRKDKKYYTVIDSTASPYKFSGNVVDAITGTGMTDEFDSINKLKELSDIPIHRAVDNLKNKRKIHNSVIDVSDMYNKVLNIVKKI